MCSKQQWEYGLNLLVQPKLLRLSCFVWRRMSFVSSSRIETKISKIHRWRLQPKRQWRRQAVRRKRATHQTIATRSRSWNRNWKKCVCRHVSEFCCLALQDRAVYGFACRVSRLYWTLGLFRFLLPVEAKLGCLRHQLLHYCLWLWLRFRFPAADQYEK